MKHSEKWIKVQDKRPCIGSTVLTYSKHYGIKIRTYQKSAFSNVFGEFGRWSSYTYDPEYWMELPSKPILNKGDNNND